MPRFRLVLLGSLALHRHDDGLRVDSIQRRQLAMIARLAMAGHNGISRDKLLLYFWGERPLESARGLLRQGLHAARRALGDDAFFEAQSTLTANEEVLVTDVGEFESAIAAGALRRAVELYTGDFLDGAHVGAGSHFEEWASLERRRLKDGCIGALAVLAEESGQQASQQAAWWRRSLSIEPLQSRAAYGLLNCLSDSGERAEAISFGRSYQALLEQNYHLAVDDRFAQLLRSIRADEQQAHAPVAQLFPAAAIPFSIAPGDMVNPKEGPVFRAASTRGKVKWLAPATLAAMLLLWFARTPPTALVASPTAPSHSESESNAGHGEEASGSMATDHANAVVLYREGQIFLARRTRPSIEHAIELYREAVAREPKFAPAHAGLALAYAILPSFSNRLPAMMHADSKLEASRAVTIDTGSAQAFVARGVVDISEHRWRSAEQELRHAIALDQGDAFAHFFLSCVMGNEDRASESLAEAKRAFELDPTSNPIAANLAAAFFGVGRNAEADKQIRRSLLLDSTYSAGYQELALVLLKEGRNDEAIASMERSIRLEGLHPFAGDLGILGYVYGIGGKRRLALAILNTLDSLARHEYVDSAAKGFVWLGLRDRDRAFLAFQNSVRSGGSLLFDYLSRRSHVRSAARGPAL